MSDAAFPESGIQLRLCGVSKAFGPRVLFRNVSAEFRAGSITLLAGSNGAGKSTLMRIMAGLGQPDSGTVERLTDEAESAFLAHATFIYSGLSARENLLFWGRCLGFSARERNAAADAALERVGLTRHAHDRAGIFSRGMAQRLNLARVLIGRPRLLLLDEPGTGLDLASRALLRDIVREARARGAAVVWISHDLDADGDLADRILTLRKKKLEESASFTVSAPSPASTASAQHFAPASPLAAEEGVSPC